MAENNAKVMFKRGTQDALRTYLNGGAVDGTFYLTSDTNRLYVGKSFTENGQTVVKAVPVNQGILSIRDIDTLKNVGEPGQFYYIEGSNVLCVKSGENWIQINPDTDTVINSRTLSANKNAETGFVTITDVIVQKSNQDQDGTPITNEFSIKGENGITVDFDNNNGKPKLIIKQAEYNFSVTGVNGKDAKILIGDDSASSDITLIAGDNVNLTTDIDNKTITLAAKDSVVESVSVDIVDGGKLKVSVEDSNDVKSAEKALVFNYGHSNKETSDSTATFKDGAFYFDVYTANEINEKFRTLDAMTYRGVTTSVPAGPHRRGDTYKATGEFQINNGTVTVKIGDLIIANGNEENNSEYITNVSWDVVESGNDSMSDTVYIVRNTTHGMEIVEEGSSNSIGGFKLESNEYLTLADSVTNAGNDEKGKINTVTVSHKENFEEVGSTVSNATKEQVAEEDFSFEIPVINYDKAGHIIGVGKEKIKVTDTVHDYSLDDFSISVNSNKATFETVLSSETANVLDKANFSISSSSLSLKADQEDANNIIVDIEWGSF